MFPSEFVRNISDIYGPEGKAWLAGIPILLEELSARWSLSSLEMVPSLTYSYIAKAKYRDGEEAILKLAPLGAGTSAEIAWYASNARGTPAVFQSAPEKGALLLQCLLPGHSLKRLVREGKDDEATQQLVAAIRNLAPEPQPAFAFKHVAELGEDLDALLGKVEAQPVNKAKSLFRELTQDRSRDLPLHGDIHHDNVLLHGDRWLVIDPHGYLGPRVFEAGAMLRNPYDCFPKGSLKKIIHRRLEILVSELPFQKDEILGWCYAYTLMAAAWSAQDHAEVPKEHLEIAALVASFP